MHYAKTNYPVVRHGLISTASFQTWPTSTPQLPTHEIYVNDKSYITEEKTVHVLGEVVLCIILGRCTLLLR